MLKRYLFAIFLLLASTYQAPAQSTEVLKQKILKIISDKNIVAGVAVSSENGNNSVFINKTKHFPMASVFKLPLALALLSEINDGIFLLNQKITISEDELLKNTWSPIRKKYPHGTTMPLSELIRFTVSLSDNNGADLLLKRIGGPQEVTEYFHKIGITGISIKVTEHEMHESWDAQFKNWITPQAANKLLRMFYYNSNNLLSQKSYSFIWRILRKTPTGQNKIRGLLPQNTIVAHKTGYSGISKKGIIAASNDIGVVTLPNGDHFFISVFITHSKESAKMNKKIIARIAKVAWDYFVAKPNS